jgi:transposase
MWRRPRAWCARGAASVAAGEAAHLVREVGATAGAILELAEHLAGEGIEEVTLGAASEYWRIWFYLLEGAGLSVQLVNAREVKNGRATRNRQA